MPAAQLALINIRLNKWIDKSKANHASKPTEIGIFWVWQCAGRDRIDDGVASSTVVNYIHIYPPAHWYAWRVAETWLCVFCFLHQSMDTNDDYCCCKQQQSSCAISIICKKRWRFEQTPILRTKSAQATNSQSKIFISPQSAQEWVETIHESWSFFLRYY